MKNLQYSETAPLLPDSRKSTGICTQTHFWEQYLLELRPPHPFHDIHHELDRAAAERPTLGHQLSNEGSVILLYG